MLEIHERNRKTHHHLQLRLKEAVATKLSSALCQCAFLIFVIRSRGSLRELPPQLALPWISPWIV